MNPGAVLFPSFPGPAAPDWARSNELMAANPRVMGDFTVTGPLRAIGWVATLVMGASAVGTIVGIFL